MTWNEEQDEVDALSLVQMDAFERARDYEDTAKAFRAVEALTEVFARATEGKCQLRDSAALIEQLRRLAQIMEDYRAVHPDT